MIDKRAGTRWPSPALPSLWALIQWRASLTPTGILAVDDRGRELTFGHYRVQSERVAAALAARGTKAGDRVGWMLPTTMEALVVAGALSRLGATQMPLLPILRHRELRFILGQSGATQLLIPGLWRGHDYQAMVEDVVKDLKDSGDDRSAPDVVVVEDALPEADSSSLLPVAADASPSHGAGFDDGEGEIRWIFYTSGTTGTPKGVLHSDATVGAFAVRLNRLLVMTDHDRNALVFPITHIGGLAWLIGGLLIGYRQILVESFNAASCEVLEREQVTIAGSAPPMWSAYLSAQRRRPGETVFPRLRALVGGGADTPSTMFDEVRDVLGVPLVTGYGLTECPGLANNGVNDSEAVLRHDGRLVDGVEVRIVAEDGGQVGADEVGEIRVRGPMLFRGYVDGRLDGAAFDDAGFFCTGDLGRIDANGSITVTGRLKDIIIRKGENISAKEVEDVLHLHPAIAEVAVIGLPDEDRGERGCAVVVLAATAATLDLNMIAEHCRRHGLSRFKIPEQLELVSQLPYNTTGKVVKSALRERFVAVDDGVRRT